MGFTLSCDRCGRFIRKVKTEDVKGFLNQEPICEVCEEIETTLHKKIATLRRKAEVDFNKVSNAYKQMVTDEIRRVVEEKHAS